MNLDNLTSFSDENSVPNFKVPKLAKSPILGERSILKPLNKENINDSLILFTPEPTKSKHKSKVTFQTPSSQRPKPIKPTPESLPPQIPHQPVQIPHQPPQVPHQQSPYDHIKELDEEENWIERTSVLTKEDHTDYLQIAGDILSDLISQIPIREESEEDECFGTPPESNITIPTEFTTPPEKKPIHTADTKEPTPPELQILQEPILDSQPPKESSLDTEEPQEPILVSEEPKESTVNLEGFQELSKKDKPTELQPSELGSKSPSQEPVLPIPAVEDTVQEPILKDTPIEDPQLEVPDAPKEQHTEKEQDLQFALTDIDSVESEAIPDLNNTASDAEVVSAPMPIPDNNKMAEENDDDMLPTPPRGAYNFNFDDFDENSDPFGSKIKMSNSPPLKSKAIPQNIDDINPFQSKKSLANSPPSADPFKSSKALANSPPTSAPIKTPSKDTDANDNFDDIDPFQSKKSLANSPPSADPFKSSKALANSPPTSTHMDANDNFNDIDPFKVKNSLANSPPSGSPIMSLNKDIDSNDNTLLNTGDSNVDTTLAWDDKKEEALKQEEKKAPVKKTPKKKGASVKKPIKKFKPPPRPANQGDGDEIQIFAPPPKNTQSSPEEPPTPTPTNQGTENAFNLEQSANQKAEKPVAMDISSESVSQKAQTPPLPNPANIKEELVTPESSAIPNDFQDEFDNEEFKPATEVFNNTQAWDMLENQGTSKEFQESALARQSLYVKFDPLVGGKSPAAGTQGPTGIPPAVQRAVNSDDLIQMQTPPTAAAKKHPASRILGKHLEEPTERKSVDDIFAFSPPPQDQSNQSGISSSRPESTEPIMTSIEGEEIVQVAQYSQTDLSKLRQELELDYQARLLARDRDWDRKYSKLEEQNKKKSRELEKMQEANDNMKSIVAEYERTVTMVIHEKEQATVSNTDTLQDVTIQRDQALEDLKSVESAFSDLHRRYEKSKLAVEGFKKNEEVLKKTIADFAERLKRQEQRYETLKQHAEEKLEAANDKISEVRKSTHAENIRLGAALKKAELQVQSTDSQLKQKTQECAELTAICDELINKVGDS
ncbi:unnamed protein product [Owenia fusiformis]|uniref:Transforming acidic coiled-coil-containing protein C-terminal domain-containing protein n=1 Tax=Owenia fusiformis TaxID=6347 RepID=A0A8S4NMF1_OWEFU|nr:unnamed protein product [Owenia fusiformis]